MLSFPVDLAPELTEDDVLRIDPVREYERRRMWREWAEHALAQRNDVPEEMLERGRPTGP